MNWRMAEWRLLVRYQRSVFCCHPVLLRFWSWAKSWELSKYKPGGELKFHLPPQFSCTWQLLHWFLTRDLEGLWCHSWSPLSYVAKSSRLSLSSTKSNTSCTLKPLDRSRLGAQGHSRSCYIPPHLQLCPLPTCSIWCLPRCHSRTVLRPSWSSPSMWQLLGNGQKGSAIYLIIYCINVHLLCGFSSK